MQVTWARWKMKYANKHNPCHAKVDQERKVVACIQAFFGLVVGFLFFPSQTECFHPFCLPWEKGFLQCWQHHGNSQVLPPSLNTLESMPWTSKSCGDKQVESLVWQSFWHLTSAASSVTEHRESHLGHTLLAMRTQQWLPK